MCPCAHAHACAQGHTCKWVPFLLYVYLPIRIWRPKVEIWCLSSIILCHVFFKQGLSLDQGLTFSARLRSQKIPEIQLSPLYRWVKAWTSRLLYGHLGSKLRFWRLHSNTTTALSMQPWRRYFSMGFNLYVISSVVRIGKFFIYWFIHLTSGLQPCSLLSS